MKCLLKSNRFWLILIIFISHRVHGAENYKMEQVAEIVCDSRMASINFRCHLEYGKIDMETTGQINKYKKVCGKALKVKKCKNPEIEDCNLATENMKKFCESKFKEIRESRLVARKIIDTSCQKAFNVTKGACVSDYLKLVKPKISKIDKFLKLVVTQKPKILKTNKIYKLFGSKPKISNIKNEKGNDNFDAIIKFIFNENKSKISRSNMKLLVDAILAENEDSPIKLPSKLANGIMPKVTVKPKIKVGSVESMINSIFSENKSKLTKEDMAKFIKHILIGDIHSKIKLAPKPVKVNKQHISRSKELKVSSAAKSLIKFIFGKTRNKIDTNDLLGFIDEVFTDAEFNPNKPLKVNNKKPVSVPNNQAVINYIFGKNKNKIHRHLMLSFIERILDSKYENFKPVKSLIRKPTVPKPKIGKLDKQGSVFFYSKPKSKYQFHSKPQRTQINPIKVPANSRKLINYIFGKENNKLSKVEKVNFINNLFSDVNINQLKPNKGHNHVKIPSVQAVIKFIFGENPKKIHRHVLVAMIERIMDIQKMPDSLIRKHLQSVDSVKPTQKPKIKVEKPSVSISSIIDYIFGKKLKKVEQDILVKFIKTISGKMKFDPKIPVKESIKPHIEMPSDKSMINFIFGKRQKKIKKPILLAFLNKIINNKQYHSEVIKLAKSNETPKSKPVSKPELMKLTKLKPADDPSLASIINFIFSKGQHQIEKTRLISFLNSIFKQQKNALEPKQPLKKPKLVSKLPNKIDNHNKLNFIFGKKLKHLSVTDIKKFSDKMFGAPKVSLPNKEDLHHKGNKIDPKFQAAVDFIFQKLKDKIEMRATLLFKDKSYVNKLYLPIIINYLLENYIPKIEKSSVDSKTKPNLLKILTDSLSKSKSNLLKNAKLEPNQEKQKPFDVSFVFNMINKLLGGKDDTPKSNLKDNSQILQDAKLKLKSEIHKENANVANLLLAILYKTVNKLLVNDSLQFSLSNKEKDEINKILSSLPIKPEKLENISENNKHLIVSLMFKTIDEIFDQLSKYSKSEIANIVKQDSIKNKFGEVKNKPFNISYALEMIDDLLNPSYNESKIPLTKSDKNKIASIYSFFDGKNKAQDGKEKPEPEKDGKESKPPGKNNKLQVATVKPLEGNEDNEAPEKEESKLENTAKPNGTVKNKKVTENPKKSAGKSKKTTTKPKKSGGKSKTTTKPKKSAGKSKKTTAKPKKTTVKPKKTTVKPKKTTKPK